MMVVRLPAQLWTVSGGVGGAPGGPFWVESTPVVTTHGCANLSGDETKRLEKDNRRMKKVGNSTFVKDSEDVMS